MRWRSWTAVGRQELSRAAGTKISKLGRAASPVPPEPAVPHGRCKPAAALWALTMRTLSLGSSRARLSSSSTTSQFSSPHLAQGQWLWTHAAPHEHFGPVVRASRASGAHAAPPNPHQTPTLLGSIHLGHLLFEEVLCLLPGQEDPSTLGQCRHQAHLPQAITQAVSIHPAQGKHSDGDSPAPSYACSVPAISSIWLRAAQIRRTNAPRRTEPVSSRRWKIQYGKKGTMQMEKPSQKNSEHIEKCALFPILTSQPRSPAPGWPQSDCRCLICCRCLRCGSGHHSPVRSSGSCARCLPPPSRPPPAPAGGSL